MTFRTTGLLQLLKRHGRNLKLVYDNVNNTYDPATGTIIENNGKPRQIRGHFYEDRNENLVEVGNRKVVFLPYDTVGLSIPRPKPGDRVEGQRDGVAIEEVQEIYSGEKLMLYICRVKE